MKKIILCLTFIFISLSQSSLLATNPISVEAFNEMHYEADEVRSENLWSKTKTWIVKKWFNVAAKISIERLSSISLIIGALSLLSLVAFFIVGMPSLILVAFIAALLGDILTIYVLQRTKNNKSEFRKERTKAWFGLILSLLTGLLPLALFAIILVILNG